MNHPKRIIFLAAVYLFVGAVVALVAPLIFVAWADYRPQPLLRPSGNKVPVQNLDTNLSVLWSRDARWGNTESNIISFDLDAILERESRTDKQYPRAPLVDSAVKCRLQEVPAPSGMVVYFERQTGWPFLQASAAEGMDKSGVIFQRGLSLPWRKSSMPTPRFGLYPTFFFPLPFAGNIAFYTLIIVGIHGCLRLIRGRHRRRRSRCTRCGYDLTGLFPAVVVCPECSHGIVRTKPT